MSEYTKTIGTVTSFDGATVTVGTDCDLVTVATPPGGVRLNREQRDEMDRLMFAADAEAFAWLEASAEERARALMEEIKADSARCDEEETSGLSLACLNGDDERCNWRSCKCDCHSAAGGNGNCSCCLRHGIVTPAVSNLGLCRECGSRPEAVCRDAHRREAAL